MIKPSARNNALALIVCGILLTTYASTSWLAWQNKGITLDEPLHLVTAVLQIRQGNFRIDQDNPPLWKDYFILGCAALNMQLLPPPGGDSGDISVGFTTTDYASMSLFRTPGNDAHALINSARARMLPLAVVLGVLIAVWAWRLAGPLAACVSVAAFSLDPNFLAHGLLVKNDVPITLLFTALMFTLWRVGRTATVLNCTMLALLLGAAVTTKFSGLLAIPVLGAGLLLRALMPAEWRIIGWPADCRVKRLCGGAGIGIFALFVSWFFIWASYDFRFQPAAGPTTDLNRAVGIYAVSQTRVLYDVGADTSPAELQKLVGPWRPDRVVDCIRWADVHRILPDSYLCGFLGVQAANLGYESFLMGESRLRGWWYYFPLAMCFKTPLATLIGLALALVACFYMPRPRNAWTVIALAIAPVAYMLAAMHSGFDLGIRHIFPVYPFLYIFLGVIAARATGRFGKPVIAILGILALALAVETFAAFPDYIPFFNVAAGGSRGGARLLGDSNIDWGQELPDLARWQADHPNYQLMLYYFGGSDPRYYGIHYVNLPGSYAPQDETHPTGQQNYWAISVVALEGQYFNAKGREFYAPFRNHKPTQILGGSIYLYAPW
jgi:hypothetical protein